MINENQYPNVKNSIIEKESLKLLNTFFKNKEFKAPIPVFDIIEFLGYNIEFKKNGIYSDNTILGGLRVKDKIVEINENISNQEGRVHFTAAHELGHIILHANLHTQENQKNKQLKMDFCRNFDNSNKYKKELIEIQADNFAAFLLMPSSLVKKTFFSILNKPLNVRKRNIFEIIFSKSLFKKAYGISNEIIKKGNFENVSKMAMMNRLIGMKLIKGMKFLTVDDYKKRRNQ